MYWYFVAVETKATEEMQSVRESMHNADGWALALSLVSGWVCHGKMGFDGWDISLSLPDRTSSEAAGFSSQPRN